MNSIKLDASTFDQIDGFYPIFLFTLSYPLLDDFLFANNEPHLFGEDQWGYPHTGVLLEDKNDINYKKQFSFIPLEIVPPSPHAEQTESGSLSISNINVRNIVVPIIRQANVRSGNATLRIDLLNYDLHEGRAYKQDVERTIYNIQIQQVNYGDESLSFQMSPFSYDHEPIPADKYIPSKFPALFRSI